MSGRGECVCETMGCCLLKQINRDQGEDINRGVDVMRD